MNNHQLSNLISLHDVEKKAMEILPAAVRGYYCSGADDEETVRANRRAFHNFLIRPYVLRDVSELDTSVHVLLRPIVGQTPPEFRRTFKYPIGISPTAFQRMACEEGEIATAKAASETGTPMICSTLATVPLEEIAKNATENTTLWFQLYVYKDRSVTERLVRRAEKAGFTGLVLTVDAPLFGRRRADERNGFELPAHLRVANFEQHSAPLSTLQGGDVGASGLTRYVISLFDASLNWDDLRWLVEFTKLPVIVKGIVRADDALQAVQAGAAGIVVSNHGGRQLDHCVPSIEALTEVAAAVKGKVPLFVDGGFRTGTDVFKALALGADMVFIGRPIVYGLAVGGKEGVKHVLGLLRTELDYAMKLSGCPSIAQIRSAKQIVVRRSHFDSKL